MLRAMPARSAFAPLAAAASRLARLGRTLRPWLQTGLRRGASLAQAGLTALARLGWHHRGIALLAGQRLLWWGALALLVLGGRAVLGLDPLPSRWMVLAPFVAGLAVCAMLRLASHRRLRVAALALGSLHGAAAVLVWTAFGS